MRVDILERVEQVTPEAFRSARWSLAIWPAIAVTGGWAAVRVTGTERCALPVQLMAFTPYVAAIGVLLPPLAVAVALRRKRRASRLHRWSPVAVSTAVALVLLGCVLPRALPDGRAAADKARGPVLRVMTSNLLFGSASVGQLTRLVAQRRVDVLAVQELTGEAASELAASELTRLLPYRILRADPGAGGSGLFSRFPLRAEGERKLPGGFTRTIARFDMPGAAWPVAIESVHTYAPISGKATADWIAGFAELPSAPRTGPTQVLLGDFNATLDHAVLRRLLRTGYRDAAATKGAGLVATWPFDGRLVPGVTIDHVLADRRVGVRGVTVHSVPGSDHRAVFAELVLPPER